MAVIVMPKSPASLDELSYRIVKEYHQEPTYIIKLDGATYTLDRDSHRMINARWIDDLELVSPASISEAAPVQGALIFRLHFKKRKQANLRAILHQTNAVVLSKP